MLIDVTTTRAVRLYQGVYKSHWWNFELEFRGRQVYELDYPDLGCAFDCIGVCDSPEQLMAMLPDEVTSGPRLFVISMVQIIKSDQPSSGGWRWHKWGGYIGSQLPQCEYLADEPVIDTVWTYHVYEVEASEALPA